MSVFSELEEALKVDRYSLDEERAHQPQLFWKVAEGAAMSRSLLDQAKADLELLEAELYKKIREEHVDERITEKTIDMTIRLHPSRIESYRKYLDRKLKTEKWDQLRDSYKDRGFALRDLAAMSIAGYYQDSSGGSSATERALDARSVSIGKAMDVKRKARQEQER